MWKRWASWSSVWDGVWQVNRKVLATMLTLLHTVSIQTHRLCILQQVMAYSICQRPTMLIWSGKPLLLGMLVSISDSSTTESVVASTFINVRQETFWCQHLLLLCRTSATPLQRISVLWRTPVSRLLSPSVQSRPMTGSGKSQPMPPIIRIRL